MNEDRIHHRANVGDQLIALEPLSPDSQKRIQQEMHAMLTRQLGIPGRLFVGFVSAASLGIALLLGYLAVTAVNLPLVARIGLGTGVPFGLAWGAVSFRVAWRGSMDLKVDARRIAAMVWVFTVVMMVFFLMVGMSAKDRMLGLMLIVQGLVFLIGAAVHFITFRIEQAELVTREKLLQLELRIAELGEKQQSK
jgi:hypothetical protein